MRFVPIKILAMAGVLAAAPLATVQAATLEYAFAIAQDYTDWTKTVSIPQVNPSQYVLTEVDLTFTGTVWNSLSYTNTGNGTSKIKTDLATSMSVTLPNNSTLALVVPDIIFAAPVASSQTFTGTKTASSDTVTVKLTNPVDLAWFVGLGNAVETLVAEAQFSGTFGGNAIMSVATKAGAALTVDYQVSAVPLPAAVTLFGSALLGLGAYARRRIKK